MTSTERAEITGKMLRERRLKFGFTQQDIAEATGRDLSVINRIENGVRGQSIQKAVDILEAYGYELIDVGDYFIKKVKEENNGE